MTRPETVQKPTKADTPRIEYRLLAAEQPLPQDVLAAVTFSGPRLHGDSRHVRVGLEPLRGKGIVESWLAKGTVNKGVDGLVRYTADDHFLLGVVEIDERPLGGITQAAEAAYTALRRFQSSSAYPHLLRVWNYFDAINAGAGDQERYKQFCVGRAAALGPAQSTDYPAATAMGRRDEDPTLQVYWLAGRRAGLPIENPRQLSAYRYPRQYGPVSPGFSRAMLVSENMVMISGTASIIGHASHHPGNLHAQIDETFTNLASVIQRAAAASPAIPPRLESSSLLKIYLRDCSAVDAVDEVLRARLPRCTPYVILAADICRADLLFEIDCVHRGT